MREEIRLLFYCAAFVVLPVDSLSAAPPASCASKFVGTWSYNGGTTRINADGTANPTCPSCVSVQTWTCNGNTYTIITPYPYTSTLSADGRQLVGSTGIVATRVGGRAVAASSKNTSPGADDERKQAARLARTLFEAGQAAAKLAARQPAYANFSIAEDRFAEAATQFRKAGETTNENAALENARKMKAAYERLPEPGASRQQRPKQQPQNDTSNRYTGLRCSLTLKQAALIDSQGGDSSKVRALLKAKGCE